MTPWRGLLLAIFALRLSACSWFTQEAQDEPNKSDRQVMGSAKNTEGTKTVKPSKVLNHSAALNSMETQALIMNTLGPCSEKVQSDETEVEDEESMEGTEATWAPYQPKVKLCRFPTISFRCKEILDGEIQGARVIEALVNQETGGVLWRGEVASEEIPSAHGERVYSKTSFKPIISQNRVNLPCDPFIATRIQRARSFNLVDAREEEFDEASEDEITFEYSISLKRYIKREASEEPTIKVRAR